MKVEAEKKMRLVVALVLGAGALGTALAASGGKQIEDARRFYETTNYSAAVNVLEGANDARSLRLLGRCYTMMNDLKRASDTLERAVEADPNNAEGYLWLGEAYGLRAQNATLTAAPLAIKTRQNIEKAYSLDPKNWDAADDLFDFYLEAPAFMGGGMEKALRMADAIAAHDPAEAAGDRARVAERRKDFPGAEQQFRSAITLAPQRAERHVDLARFLARRARYAESDAEFAQAFAVSPDMPKIIYARADTLIQANRNVAEAKQLLTRYMALKLTPDDPPRDAAAKLLRKASGS